MQIGWLHIQLVTIYFLTLASSGPTFFASYTKGLLFLTVTNGPF